MARSRYGLPTFLALLLTLPALCLSQERESTKAAVNAALDAFHRAAAEADFARYSELMTAEVVFLGTDATERWQGREFRDFARPHFDDGSGWTYVPSERQVTLADDGNIAWFDEALQHVHYGRCRGSGVLVRDEQGWRIAQYNLSVPVPNALLPEVVQRIRTVEADADTGE
jgi:ketosteroid isomerase-like protein